MSAGEERVPAVSQKKGRGRGEKGVARRWARAWAARGERGNQASGLIPGRVASLFSHFNMFSKAFSNREKIQI